MSAINIILTNYKKSFDYKGRQGIKEYWIFFLFFVLIFFLLIFLVLGKEFVYFSILFPFVIIPFLSATVRRLHDGETSNKKTYTGLGFTITFLLINFIKIKLTFIQGIIIFIWFSAFIVYLLRESNPKVNGYGKFEKW